MTTTTHTNALELLVKFVNQRPRLDFNNYGDRKIYQREMYEITKDMHDFYELLRLANNVVPDLSDKVREYLEKSNDRLTLNGDKLQYITGQYFPTEYRPASCRVLKSIIWREYMNAKNGDGTTRYETGHDIRKAIKKYVSRRVAKNYFN